MPAPPVCLQELPQGSLEYNDWALQLQIQPTQSEEEVKAIIDQVRRHEVAVAVAAAGGWVPPCRCMPALGKEWSGRLLGAGKLLCCLIPSRRCVPQGQAYPVRGRKSRW
jgi:hypothetical protein